MKDEKQIDTIIDLLTEFDEMGFIPSVMVPNPEAYAIKWREEITKAIVAYRKQKEGEWISLESSIGLYACSLCDHRILRAKCNYCPNCGAKMKGGEGYGMQTEL